VSEGVVQIASFGPDVDPERVMTARLGLVARVFADYAGEVPGTSYLPFGDRVVLESPAGSRALSGPDGALTPRSVELEVSPIRWGRGAFGPEFEAHHARLTLDGGGRKLVLAERLAPSADLARASLEPLASALRARFVAPADPGAPEAPETPDAHRASGQVGLVPRFSLAREGDVIVLRDFEDAGPRGRAGRFVALAVVLLAASLGAGWLTWSTYAAVGPTTTVAGYLVSTLVLAVGAFAMSRIAAFARRYAPTHAPLAWFGDDRVVVLPWVSREGAVDRRPEGRLGAAIPIGEIDEVVLEARDGAFAVTMRGPHGPMDVATTPDRAAAEELLRSVRGLVTTVASPRRRRVAAAS
jgi:hypothetical protein